MAVIEVRNVWKKYKQYHDKGSTLKEKLLFRQRTHYEARWVLRGVSVDVEKGQTVGLLGENGSGKSTLLKLLTRISYPNQGEIEIRGKVSSLLELGAGFHPDMTGRENIYINASIFGLTKVDIDGKLGNIIAFSELEDYIDSPVRTYSSGMYMRLAFSVAINVDADILLIDEILAVGDLNFQKKCFKKLQQLKLEGVTVVLVSHDLASIEKLCDRALWIHEGHVAEFGPALTVCKKYLQYMLLKDEQVHQRESAQGQLKEAAPDEGIQDLNPAAEQSSAEETELPAAQERQDRWGNESLLINEVILEDSKGASRYQFNTDDAMVVRLRYKKLREIATLGFGIAIKRADGVYCYGTNTIIDDHPIDPQRLDSVGEVCCQIQRLGLIPGSYALDVAAHDADGLAYDYRIGVVEFAVYSDIRDEGICRMPHQWSIQGNPGNSNECEVEKHG